MGKKQKSARNTNHRTVLTALVGVVGILVAASALTGKYPSNVSSGSQLAAVGTCSASTTWNGTSCVPITGTISAAPKPCTIPVGAGVCSTTVSWTSNLTGTEVYVRENPSGAYVLWSSAGASSSAVAPWIRQSTGNTFELRNPATKAAIASVAVYGVCAVGSSWSGTACVAASSSTATPTASITFNGSTALTGVNPLLARTWAWNSTNADTVTAAVIVSQCDSSSSNGTTSPWTPWTGGGTTTGSSLSGSNVATPGSSKYGCLMDYTYTARNSASGKSATASGSVRFVSRYVCTGTTPQNASLYTGDDIGLTASTTKRYASTNTSRKCEYRCNTGYKWTGSTCR